MHSLFNSNGSCAKSNLKIPSKESKCGLFSAKVEALNRTPSEGLQESRILAEHWRGKAAKRNFSFSELFLWVPQICF